MSNQQLKYTLSLQDLFTGKMNAAIKQTQKMDGVVSKLQSSIAMIGVGFGVREIVQTTAKFQSLENAIKATGDAKNLQFLNEQVDRLGLDITAAYQGYKTFSGALMGTALAGEQGNKVFRQVSEAATVMGLSGEQTEGAFLALGQMMGKGTVSAEELRGQLGERIPGAFQIAAKAMGVTTAQLGKMMQQGEIVAEDFLPKFGNELEKRFGKQAAGASESLQANLNKLDASWQRLKVSIGNELLPTIIKIVKVLSNLLKVVKAFFPVIKAAIILWGSYYLKMKIATWQTTQFALAQRAMSMGMSASSVATGFLKKGIQGIGTAIKSIPIIGWVLALVDAFMYLWDTFEGFRAFFYGLWDGIKVLFDQMGLKIKGLWHQLQGLMSGDVQLIQIGIKESALADAMGFLAEKKGQQRGIASFRSENGTDASTISDMAGGGAAGLESSNKKGSLGSGSEVSGARPQNLNINIEKLVETLEIKASSVTEGAAKIKEMVTQALLESVNDLNMITR
jgi:tape measure domain-containing protein